MNLTVSYNPFGVDWFVGQFYSKFTEFLNKIPNVNINYIHLNDFAEKYDCDVNYMNGFPSVFNVYNLIIMNNDNNKTFIHSWHDYAPAILEIGSGIEKFDVVKFACSSRLTQSIIDIHKNIIIQPSTYILENISDLDLIEKYKNSNKLYDKIYMNAKWYGAREYYYNILSSSDRFVLKRKDFGDYLDKEEYFKEFSQYKFALNLDGAAKICYRDLEAFGLGILSIREHLDMLTYEQLISNKHYLEIIDDDIKSKIHNISEKNYILEKIETKLNEALTSGQYEYIINEAFGWYERNCLLENQIKIMYSFLNDFEIFN